MATRQPIVAPKKDDILFYYVKDELNRAKLKLRVLEYPSGDSFRDIFARVEQVYELTFDEDEIKEGFEDIFDIRDVDPNDILLDEFQPRSVEELLTFSTSIAANRNRKQEDSLEEIPTKAPTALSKGGRRKTPRKTKKSKRKTRSKAGQRKSKYYGRSFEY